MSQQQQQQQKKSGPTISTSAPTNAATTSSPSTAGVAEGPMSPSMGPNATQLVNVCETQGFQPFDERQTFSNQVLDVCREDEPLNKFDDAPGPISQSRFNASFVRPKK